MVAGSTNPVNGGAHEPAGENNSIADVTYFQFNAVNQFGLDVDIDVDLDLTLGFYPFNPSQLDGNSGNGSGQLE